MSCKFTQFEVAFRKVYFFLRWVDNNLTSIRNHVNNIRTNGSFCKIAKKLKLMLFCEICTFNSYVFVSKNRAKGHGISLFWSWKVMKSHGIWSAKMSMNPVKEICMRVSRPVDGMPSGWDGNAKLLTLLRHKRENAKNYQNHLQQRISAL